MSERVPEPARNFAMNSDEATMLLIWYNAHLSKGTCRSTICSELATRLQRWRDRVNA